MTRPADGRRVVTAIRLGWAVAEVRGRNRPDALPALSVPVPDPGRGHPLPLGIERSRTQCRVAAQAGLIYLARELHVDCGPDRASFAADVDQAAHDLHIARCAPRSARAGAQAECAWQALSKLIWQFDAHIQDQLAAASGTESAGYQLGRGLAETYWALDPVAPAGWASWAFLLDKKRCNELMLLTGRLSAYMQPFSAAAIAGSLEVWQRVAGDREWRRQPTTVEDLYRQIRNWYELVVLDQDPTKLIQPYRLLKDWRVVCKAATIFLPQLLLAALGLGAVVVLPFALGAGHSQRWLAALTSVLAAVGLTTSALTAKLKSASQALTTRLKQDTYTDLIAESITTASPPPRQNGQQKAVFRAVRNRTITPSTPLP